MQKFYLRNDDLTTNYSHSFLRLINKSEACASKAFHLIAPELYYRTGFIFLSNRADRSVEDSLVQANF